mgnify:CR=1 FL=1
MAVADELSEARICQDMSSASIHSENADMTAEKLIMEMLPWQPK